MWKFLVLISIWHMSIIVTNLYLAYPGNGLEEGTGKCVNNKN